MLGGNWDARIFALCRNQTPGMMGKRGRRQEAVALGHIFNWQGENAPQSVLIFDPQGKRFDFLFLTF